MESIHHIDWLRFDLDSIMPKSKMDSVDNKSRYEELYVLFNGVGPNGGHFNVTTTLKFGSDLNRPQPNTATKQLIKEQTTK